MKFHHYNILFLFKGCGHIIYEMPLIERAIEPITVSRGTVAAGIQNELECVTNYTLSRLIQQLSSLSKHSEDLFGELHQETCRVMIRTQNIHDRVERLKQKITQLNPTVEEGGLFYYLQITNETRKLQCPGHKQEGIENAMPFIISLQLGPGKEAPWYTRL